MVNLINNAFHFFLFLQLAEMKLTISPFYSYRFVKLIQ